MTIDRILDKVLGVSGNPRNPTVNWGVPIGHERRVTERTTVKVSFTRTCHFRAAAKARKQFFVDGMLMVMPGSLGALRMQAHSLTKARTV